MRYDSCIDYYPQQPWLPLSEMIMSWEDDFHNLMLNDQVRMVAYETAIKQTVKPGDVVLDLGAGTGILSQWAFEAGAKKVYAIEMDSKILHQAVQRINQPSFIAINQISFQVELPERVDVMISEIIGNMADNEDFQPILHDAIKRFLKPNGVVLPESIRTYIVPVNCMTAHENLSTRNIASINKGYNLDQLLREKNCPSLFDLYYDMIVPRTCYLAEAQIVKQYHGKWLEDPVYSKKRRFLVDEEGYFTGFKCYFIAQLSTSVSLNIGDDDIKNRKTSDSWKHAYLPVEKPIYVHENDVIELIFSRAYQPGKDVHFRQHYWWRGEIFRDGLSIFRFSQGLGRVQSEQERCIHED